MYTPAIKGKFLKKKNQPEPTGRDFAESVGGVAGLVFELKQLQSDVIETIDSKIDEVDGKLSNITDKVDKEVARIVNTTKVLQDTQTEAIDLIKQIKTGPAGRDADEEMIEMRITSKIPEQIDVEKLTNDILSKVPRLDEKSLANRVLQSLPKNKASLKIIQEKFEVDPMSVIEKIMALPDDKFKLKSSQIDGLEQTISAFRNQLGRGYLHGGGASLLTQLNDVTITSPSNGDILTYDGSTAKWINGTGGGGSGTVTTVSVVTANGVSGSVATATTTPAITLTLGAITPTSVNGLTLAAQAVGFTIAGGTTPKTLTVPLDATVSGTNTGDQTITLTGDVTGSGTGSFATTIKNDVALAGNPTTTTQTAGNNSTRIATTAFVATAVGTPVTSVSGTTNRITSTGGQTPVIDISASYVGQASITTLGTITSGTWNGSLIIGTYGGTGVNNGTKTFTYLKNISFTAADDTGVYTLPTGTKTLVATDVTTLSSLASVGTITTGTWSATIITLAKGGTGADLSGVAKGGIISGTGAGAVAITAVGSDGQVLSADAASAGGVKWIASGGTGTVTTVSVVSANGFAGSVANATTTPAITLTTSITGTLQGNGTAISASKVTLTQPATGSTLTIVDGKTLTINKTMSFTAADDTGVYTLPTGTKTLVATDVATLSSLTSIGTIATGTWNATVIGAAYGGTGIANNAASTITISGSFATTLTVSNTTSVTLPTSGTLATLAGSETLSNKTLTAPKFANAGFIADANGNEEIIFTTTASAVNEITLANAATGGNPSITASGGDTNIDLTVAPKGTGAISFGVYPTKIAVPTADGTASGPTTISFNAGYTTTLGDLVYLDSSATWQKTDANSSTTYIGLLGIALVGSITSGNALWVALPGSMVYMSAAFPTFTVGGNVYMSETAGAVTQTQPTTTDAAIRIVGFAVHADKMFFHPSPDYITHT